MYYMCALVPEVADVLRRAFEHSYPTGATITVSTVMVAAFRMACVFGGSWIHFVTSASWVEIQHAPGSQVSDTTMRQRHPTGRAELGQKWSVAVGANSLLIGWITDRADRNDIQLSNPTLNAGAVNRLMVDIETLHLDRVP